MDPMVIRYGIMAVAASISGFFLVGFTIYTIYSAVKWFVAKKSLEKIWAGLTGIVLNGLIFALTFPKVFPVAVEAFEKIVLRFGS